MPDRFTNGNSNETSIINTGYFKEIITDYKTGKDVITEQSFNTTIGITLEPKSVLILELKK